VLPYHRPAIWLGWAVVTGGAVGLTALAAGSVVRWWRRGRQRADGEPGLPLALLGLAAVPAVMLLVDHQHPYQFGKLLITVCPLYALGLVALTNLISRAVSSFHVTWSRAVWVPTLAAIGVAAV